MPRFVLAFVVFAMLLPVSLVAQKSQKGGGTPAGGSQSQGGGGAGPSSGGGSSPFFETEMLAYGGVNELAYAIANTVCSSGAIAPGAQIIIYDQTSFQNLQAWQAFKGTGAMLESAYRTLLPPPAAGAPATGTGTFASPAATGASASPAAFFAGSDVANLIGALAASTTNTASTFTLPDSAVAVSLLHQFARIPGCPARLSVKYYPLKGDSADSLAATTSLQAVVEPVNAARRQVQLLVNGVADATKSAPYLVFGDLNTQYDLWLGSLITSIAQNQTPSPFTPGPNPGITSLLQGAELEKALTGANTYILYANAVAAGGTQRDRKNILTLFVGDFITYSGGVIMNFGVVKPVGNTVVMADVLRYRSPNTRLHDAHESKLVESVDSEDNVYSLCGNEKKGNWPGGTASDPPCTVLKDKP